MIIWLEHNWMELAGTFFAIIYIYLSIRENIWLWPMGFLTSFIYLLVFFRSQLYANMGLQLYYLLISVYGWFHWLGNQKKTEKIETNLPTKSIAWHSMIWYIILVGVIMIVIIGVLKTLPQLIDIPASDLLLADAFTTAAGIVATWMLARKILENWLIWIVANTVSVVMYSYKELYVTTLLYLIYLVMAVVGYNRWKRNMKPNRI